MALVGLGLVVVGAVRAATCRTVFGVALYRWATGDGAMGPFSEADLRGAVGVRALRFRRLSTGGTSGATQS